MKRSQAPQAEGCDSGTQEHYQPFPARSTKLGKNLDLRLAQLKKRLSNENGKVYAYILTTVALTTKGKLKQKGSAPNFLGNCISLCTCKRRMRTWLDESGWEKGVWIAGITNLRDVKERYVLFYLMRVGRAFESHFDLWQARRDLKMEYGILLKAKAAHKQFLGDVFRPHNKELKGTARFAPENYFRPVEGRHSHSQVHNPNEWRIDIKYNKGSKRRAFLLVGNPKWSFLWSEPKLRLRGDRHARTKKYGSLAAFLKSFK